MAGRDVFARAKPAIIAITAILGILPRFLFNSTWPVLELVPWKFGIALRYLWAKRLAKSCGDNVVFETGVRVTFWEHIEIGCQSRRKMGQFPGVKLDSLVGS